MNFWSGKSPTVRGKITDRSRAASYPGRAPLIASNTPQDNFGDIRASVLSFTGHKEPKRGSLFYVASTAYST
jgi:hypothetical protein